MGKKISVASSVSNLGGDVADRPQILKQVVIGGLLTGTDKTVSEVLTGTYLHGGGIKLRSFYKWANKPSGYNSVVGGSSSMLSSWQPIDPTLVEPFIPRVAPYQSIVVSSVEIETDMALAFCTVWMKTNHPLLLDTDWTAIYLTASNEFEITLVDDTKYRFIQPGYLTSQSYLVASYSILTEMEPVGTILGSFTPITDPDFPILGSEWEEVSNTITPTPVTLTTKVLPAETVHSSTVTNVDVRTSEYKRITFVGQISDTNAKEYKEERTYFDTTYTVSDGAPYVVEGITYVSQIVTVTKQVKTDEITLKTELDSDSNLFIYGKGGAIPELNALFSLVSSVDEGYFPYIPLRIDNESIISDGTLYPWCKKAYRRSFGENKFQKLLDRLNENPDLDKMDYAYVVFGCSLNTSDAASLEYIYRLFKRYELLAGNGIAEYVAWRDQQSTWVAGSGNPDNNSWFWASPNTTISITSPPVNAGAVRSITVGSDNNPTMNYNINIKWKAVEERLGGGIARAGAKVGDIWVGTPPSTGLLGIVEGSYSIIWQYATNAWKSITIVGLEYTNKVYGDKSVVITAQDALADASESGFIIPLNYAVFREMSLIDSTQLGVSCRYMVINAYEIRKQKWWEKWWGVLIIAVVSVGIGMATGLIGASTVGIFGTAGAVGASVGLTGMAAVFLGSVINIFVASLLLQKVATPLIAKLLGDKWASILMPLLMLAAPLAFGGAGMSITSMFQPENLLRITDAAVTSYTTYLQYEVSEINAEADKQMKQYALESKQISDKYQKEFGSGVTNLHLAKKIVAETADEFFARTQLTGSDIVALSKSFLNADVMRQIDTML